MFVTKALIYERFPEKQSQKDGLIVIASKMKTYTILSLGCPYQAGHAANPSNFDESLYAPKTKTFFPQDRTTTFSEPNRQLGIVNSRKIYSNKHSPSCWGNIFSWASPRSVEQLNAIIMKQTKRKRLPTSCCIVTNYNEIKATIIESYEDSMNVLNIVREVGTVFTVHCCDWTCFVVDSLTCKKSNIVKRSFRKK